MSQPSPLTPLQFVDRWRGSTSTERQAYQQHFLDLCHLVGHPIPAELDRENQFFTFEAGAAKQSGGQGWADMMMVDGSCLPIRIILSNSRLHQLSAR